MGTFTTIPANQLKLSPDNTRKSAPSKQADAELKASIAAVGILQNLVVKKSPRGKTLVHAGARRFRLLQELVKEKILPANTDVPCYLLEREDNEEEAALIENTLRSDMHPVDAFESYYRLFHVDKMPVTDIASRHGKSQAEVKRLLRLGNVHPDLREKCRDGKLDLDALMAYACTDDQEKQIAAYKSMTKESEWMATSPHRIRERIMNEGYRSDHKLVKFIGLPAYRKAGGNIIEDMFSKTRQLTNADLVEHLVTEKLEEQAEDLRKEWSWADIDLNFASHNTSLQNMHPDLEEPTPETLKKMEAVAKKIEPLQELEDSEEGLTDAQQKELDELLEEESDLEEAALPEMYSPEQKKLGGCVITIDYTGKLDIYSGYLRKEDAKKLEAQADTDGNSPPETAAPEQANYSMKLQQDLSHFHLGAARLDVLYDKAVALKLLHFTLCWKQLTRAEQTWGSNAAPLDITFNHPPTETGIEDPQHTQNTEELKRYNQVCDTKWFMKDNPVGSFRLFCMLPTNDIEKLLVWVAACTLQAKQIGEQLSIIDIALEMAGSNISKRWHPTAENFFKRINRTTAESCGASITQDDLFADGHKNQDKKNLALILEEHIQQQEPGSRWLPDGMVASQEGEPEP